MDDEALNNEVVDISSRNNLETITVDDMINGIDAIKRETLYYFHWIYSRM